MLEYTKVPGFSDSVAVLYQGSSNPNLQVNSKFNNSINDYGRGLYLTPSYTKAFEWAFSKYNKNPDVSYTYTYYINLEGLKVLDLSNLRPAIWVAVLMSNRPVDSHFAEFDYRCSKLKELISFDVSEYDVIYGYRADDSYYTYATEFVSGMLTEETLGVAMSLGKLGAQYCVKSDRAFNNLHLVKRDKLDKRIYGGKFNKVDRDARNEFARLRNIGNTFITNIVGGSNGS